MSPVVPYLIFSILVLTFSAVPIKSLRPSMLDLWLCLFQVVVSVGSYVVLRVCGVNEFISQGVLIGVLCPVASSVSVVACMLGANRKTTTTYTIIGNLLVAFVAPLIFTIIGANPELSFFHSLVLILYRIFIVLGLPFILVLLFQIFLPKVNDFVAKYNGLSFYFWSFALLFTLGQTMDYIFKNGEGHWTNIIWLGVWSLFFCALQFGFGKWLGSKYGDTMAGGQLLGQKNSAMGIWMANTFLNPISAVFLAFYSIYQNLFNSWQIWYFGRKQTVCKINEKR